MSNCCDDSAPASGDALDVLRIGPRLSRRTFLHPGAGPAGLTTLGGVPGAAWGQDGSRIRLAFCSQLLCVVPYELTRAGGFFEAEGLDVELIYTRGGSAALQALHGGAVEYAAASFDAALNAFKNGAEIVRFATTGRLPLFALATSPENADSITELADLEGAMIGVSALGNADHSLMLYLLQRAGVDQSSVEFATIGTNLYDALRLGQVDAGMVQEPALSLLQEDGARVLVNVMDIDDAQEYLGGPYEFMGVAVRRDEVEERREQMQALGRALAAGLKYLQETSAEELVDALPRELVTGGDRDAVVRSLERYRASLYPTSVDIDIEAMQRVVDIGIKAGLDFEDIDLDKLVNTEVITS